MPASVVVTPMSHIIIDSFDDDADGADLEDMTHQYILVVSDKVPVKLSPLEDFTPSPRTWSTTWT